MKKMNKNIKKMNRDLYIRFDYGDIAYTGDQYLRDIYYDDSSLEENIVYFREPNDYLKKVKLSTKPSLSITGQILIGDIVNGCLVISVNNDFIQLDSRRNWGFGEGCLPVKYITSILTKERHDLYQY